MQNEENMTFTVQGTKYFHFWERKGNIDLSIIPKGTIREVDIDLPIRLQVGNPSFGYQHIEKKHSRHFGDLSTHEFIYNKLGQSGTIYTTEEESKLKILLRVSPSSLLVLRMVDHNSLGWFLTIVSIYPKEGRVDGKEIGRYISDYRI